MYKKIQNFMGRSNFYSFSLLGLFHRAILIAGSSHSPWALIQEPYLAGQSVAAALNCLAQNNSSSLDHNLGGLPITTTTTANSNNHVSDPVLECLKTKHFSEFGKFSLPKFSVDFGPSVDGIVIKSNFRVRQI